MNGISKITAMPKPYLLEVLGDYLEVEKNITEIIKSTGYKNEFIAQKLNMPISTYYTKRRTKSFAAREVLQIVKMMYDDETYNAAELELIQSRMNDEVMSGEDFMEKINAMIKQ